jgi:glycosyltransferase involved in cell wall biosynthesis
VTPPILWIVAALTAAYWLSLLARARLLGPPLPALPQSPPNPERPLISILVAVRNEMDRILVESLSSFIAQDYPAVEIVAVDDHSEDDSRRVLLRLAAGHSRLRVIDAAAGGVGKRAALIAAADAARGTWLLFTDADVRLTPDAVRRGVDYAIEHRIDALSLLPRTLAVSLVEQTALAAVSWLVFEGGQLRRCNRDDAPVGLAAAGPFLLVSREAFDKVGGYAAIPQNVLIDVALATRLRERGCRYRYLRSDGCAETRMYRSLGEIWRGFGKNAYLALGNRAAIAIGAVATATALTWLPPIMLIAGLARGDGIAAALAAVAYGSMAATQYRGGIFMGTKLRPAALTLAPLGALLWLAIVAQSAWRTRARSTVVWKGRALPVFDRPADR